MTTSFKALPHTLPQACRQVPLPPAHTRAGEATFEPRKIWVSGRGLSEGRGHAPVEIWKRLMPLVDLRFPAPLGRRGLPRRTVLPPRDGALPEKAIRS